MKKHKGGISIFLIIIVVATVTFGGVFADMTRILVAKNRVRTATESAVRSTLAEYSENLVSEWGLFGINTKSTDINSIFKKYLENNLNTANSENMGNLINYEILNASVDGEKNLGKADVFQEKINEYSKYRAPVSLCLGVIDKFKAIFSKDMKDISIDVEGTVNNITGKIGGAFTNLTKNTILGSASTDVKANTSNGGKLQAIDLGALDNWKDDINGKVGSVVNQISEYKKSVEDYQEEGRKAQEEATKFGNFETSKENNGIIGNNGENIIEGGKKPYATGATDKYEGESDDEITLREEQKAKANEETELINDIKKKAKEATDKEDSVKATIASEIEKARALAKEYNKAVATFDKKCSEIETELSSAGIGKTVEDVLACDVNDAKKTVERVSELEGLLLGKNKEDLESKKKEKKHILELFDKLINEDTNIDVYNTEALKEYIGDNGAGRDTYKDIKSLILDCCDNKEGKNFKEYYEEKIKPDTEGTLNEIETDLKNFSDLKNLLDKNYSLYEFVVKNKGTIAAAKKARDEAAEKANAYNAKVEEIENINLYNDMGIANIPDFNAGVQSDKDSNLDTDSYNEKIKEIKDEIEKIAGTWVGKTMPGASDVNNIDNISGGKISMFNKLKDKFNQLKNIVTNPGNKFYLVDYIMSKCTYLTSQTTRKHYFDHTEVEYIIFGQKTQLDNAIYAIGEIALIRFAINAVNYWITTPGELIARTVGAVVRGLARTAVDMTTMLLDGGDSNSKGLIAICPSLSKYKVLSYSDHLRILLLLHLDGNGGADALKRCIHATMKNSYNENLANMENLGSEDFLSEYATQIKADTEVDVDLYFIPLLLPDFVNFGNIHNGKYKVQSSITYGY